MSDPYWRYATPSDPASIARASFPGYIPTESASTLSTPYHSWPATSDYMPNDGFAAPRSGAYGTADVDPALITQKRDLGFIPAVTDILNDRPSSIRPVDGLAGGTALESNVLFVDGLPNDCSRREVGHLFRPFIGFREIRVVHKEPRRNGDKAMVLCFVEFTDAKCALTALEALQGYKFDNKKPESPLLKIHFAHFPFHLPADGPS